MSFNVGFLTYKLDRSFTGVGRYSVELASALTLLTKNLDFFVLSAGGIGPLNGIPNAKTLRLSGCRRYPMLVSWGNIMLWRAAKKLNLDIIHDPNGLAPFLFCKRTVRTIVTIHDVFPWAFGHNTVLDTLVYRYWLPHIAKTVDGIITASEFSKRDIVQYLRVDAEKVKVIPHGVNEHFHPRSYLETRKITNLYGLPDKYLLFVGSIEKRKNVSRLLRAYASLRTKGEQRALVVVGGKGKNAHEIMKDVTALNLEGYILWLGYVPYEHLPGIYCGADLFIFPSLYEGFGLPILEAMACGTPVICSNNSSLSEVAGKASIYFDPTNVDDMTESIQQVLSDNDLLVELSIKGIEHAQLFTWNKSAHSTREIYDNISNL